MCEKNRSRRAAPGCAEYATLDRRRFLSLSGGAFGLALAPGWLPRVAWAASENSSRDVLVSIFLRGGADGLTLCVPHGEDAYYSLRPRLAIPRPDAGGSGQAVDLDGFFGLPPAMQPLLETWQDGKLAIVHATGLDGATRSHFEAMHAVEVGRGEPPASLFTGWLGRHLAATAPTRPDALLRALALGHGIPRHLVGAPQSIPVDDPSNVAIVGNPDSEAERRLVLEDLYARVGDPLESAARDTLATLDLLQAIDFDGYLPQNDAAYPESELGTSLSAAAALIRADVGVEAVTLDVGGWDTHELQGPLEGDMSFLMGDLAASLAAFLRDLAGRNVVVVAMTEFGRNAFENGSAGTDHGHGSAMLVLGEHVAGGRVVTQWPGLAPGQLYENQDLQVTIDYRDIVAEILEKRLDSADVAAVFDDPDWTPTVHGIVVRETL